MSSSIDTMLQVPTGLAISHRSGRVLVTDVGRPALVVLDGESGATVEIKELTGLNGSEKWVSPEKVAVSRNGTVAVYDAGRQSVDILRPDLTWVRRITLGVLAINVKGLAVLDDTSIILAGATAAGPATDLGVFWIETAGGLREATRPSLGRSFADGKAGLVHARKLVAGGPLAIADDGTVLFGQATTGNIWSVSRQGTKRLATGPGAVSGLLDNVIRRSDSAPASSPTIWWTFPQTVLLDQRSPTKFWIAMSYVDSALVRLFELEQGSKPRQFARWTVRLRNAVRYDRQTAIVIVENQNGALAVGRVTYPPRDQDARTSRK